MSAKTRPTAIRALEDFGYEPIDNLPMRLIPRLLSGEPHDRPLALGFVKRGPERLGEEMRFVDHLRGLDFSVRLTDPVAFDTAGGRMRG